VEGIGPEKPGNLAFAKDEESSAEGAKSYRVSYNNTLKDEEL